MKVSLSSKALAGIVFSSVLLTACGGGSGDGDKPSAPPTVTPPPVTTPPVTTPPVTTTPPPVTPSTGKKADELRAGLAVDNFISMQRQACGIGGYNYDEKLAEVSNKHGSYLGYLFSNVNLANVNHHNEDTYNNQEKFTGPGNPFFTGVKLMDRLAHAKYSGPSFMASENIVRRTERNVTSVSKSPEDAGISMARALLSAPYHLRSLTNPDLVNSGSSVAIYTPANSDPKTSFSYILTSTASSKRNAAPIVLSGITTYPCGATTGTNTALYNESPDPTKDTGRNLRTDPIGQPVHVKMSSAKTMKVSNIKFTDVARKIDMPVQVIDYNSDPYKGTNYELPANEAFIMPLTDSLNSCEQGTRKNCGLYGNSKYTVSFDVLVDNKDLQTKSFTFSTGSVNY